MGFIMASTMTARAAGPAEHALPLFYALMLRVLRAHPEMARALALNQQRLVSPFDVTPRFAIF